MRLLDVQRAAGAILPHGRAVSGTQSVDVHTFARPHTGGDVHDPVLDCDAASKGPAGDQSAVAEHALLPRAAVETPQKLAIGSGQTVQIAVVGSHKHAAGFEGGCEAHGRFREEAPPFPTGGQVERVDFVIG